MDLGVAFEVVSCFFPRTLRIFFFLVTLDRVVSTFTGLDWFTLLPPMDDDFEATAVDIARQTQRML